MNNGITNILLIGVGGQGIILASELISHVAQQAGLDVKKSEIHGMAQRGGSVNTQVRFGEQVFSPIIPKGQTEVLLSFEMSEPLRWIPFCNEQTSLIVNDQKIHSLFSATGLAEYPSGIKEEIKGKFPKASFIDGYGIAQEVGNPKVVNTILLGVLASRLQFEKESWLDAIKHRLAAKAKQIDVNLTAFERGWTLEKV